jgi:hypothetical protein
MSDSQDTNHRTSVWSYYRFAVLATLVIYGAVAVYAVLSKNWDWLYIVPLLAVVEVTLSFDNAVVNAKYVQRLSPRWQKRFLLWGILIAVVGMRLLFPIIVVTATALMNPIHVVELAFTDPRAYADALESAHVPLVVFGGIYLFQIFLTFVLDHKKEINWLTWAEKPFEWFGKRVSNLNYVVVPVSFLIVGTLPLVWPNHWLAVLISGCSAIVLYQAVSFAGDLIEGDNDGVVDRSIRNQTGRAAVFTFMYLELQDAMFSFDGVLGAFAFTVLIVLIMAGLGIGALYVRSMTIHLVETEALAKFPYLGNGAFWAIGFLPFAMWFRFPEYITGGVAFLLITAAFLHSVYDNHRKAVAIDAVGHEVPVGTN